MAITHSLGCFIDSAGTHLSPERDFTNGKVPAPMTEFYKTFDELMANLGKSRSKKNLLETAQQFSELAAAQDAENPFLYHQIALARFGEMQCYEKLEDKTKLVRTAIVAARTFVKSATFNIEISKSIRETWSDPLSDGIQCYKTAIAALEAEQKPNLAVATLMELGKIESDFEFFHYAGNVYEEVVDLCLSLDLRPRLLLDALNRAIECYSKCDRFDLAMILVDNTVSKCSTNIREAINASMLLKKDYADLKAVSVLLDIANLKFGSFAAQSQLAEPMRQFLKEFSEATQREDKALMLKAFHDYTGEFTPTQRLVISKSIDHLEKALEIGQV